MKTQSTTANGIDMYIAGFPEETQKLLEELRETILNAAPGAQQVISYQMPAFKLNRVLVYFAAYNNHIGFYPTASGIEVFKTELSQFKWSKGAVQFPLDKTLPVDLITKIVKFRVEEDSLTKKKK